MFCSKLVAPMGRYIHGAPIPIVYKVVVFGASLSEPHTSELTLQFCQSVCHTSVWYVRRAAGANSIIATGSLLSWVKNSTFAHGFCFRCRLSVSTVLTEQHASTNRQLRAHA